MKSCKFFMATAIAAMLLVGTAPADVIIDGDEVNISGATLFLDFFKSPSSTNDWIDADDDNEFGFDPEEFTTDQLAPGFTCSWQGWWLVQYRGIGSGNGLAELVDWHLLGEISEEVPSGQGLINRVIWANGGEKVGTGCGEDWPSGTPVAPTRVDMAVLDVPVRWFVQYDETGKDSSAWDLDPGDPGYGKCPTLSWDTGYKNTLKRLDREDPNDPNAMIAMNTNVSDPDDKTIFDTRIAWVPIGIISNRGADKENLKVSELRHLFLTGRLPSGENLVAATRDSGSGTRNGGMNSLGIDPSWARGDNLGSKNKEKDLTKLGPDHQATMSGGSSVMEAAVQRRRLAVGYTGLAGGSRAAADAAKGYYEITNVMYDDRRGTEYVRPSLDNILDNLDPNDAWQIGGPETFATKGDPFGDPNDVNSYFMQPEEPGDYIRNIVESIREFAPPPCVVCDPNNPWICNPYVTDPNDPLYCDPNMPWLIECDPNCDPNDPNGQGSINPESQFNMPGEYLATTFFLLDAVDGLPELDNPNNFVVNPTLNQNLQDYIRDNSTLVVPPYGTRDGAGLVPDRVPQPCWEWELSDPNDPNSPLVCADQHPCSDGSNNGAYYNYFTDDYNNPNGGGISGGAELNLRNKVQGDFNNDGERDMDDIPAMLAALNDRVAYATDSVYYTPWVENAASHSSSNDPVVPEIIGDFNGDGNFDAEDVRYFADGLALVPGRGDLNRKEAFILVDETWCELTGTLNFFGTTIDSASGCYAVGDSRFDVAGNDTTPGAGPAGADLVVDATDRAYIADNFGDWSVVDDAIVIDLSCDATGDLVVDGSDLTEIDLVLAAAPFLGDLVEPWCCIDLSDLAEMLASYNKCLGDPGYNPNADLVGGDDCVTLSDLAQLLGNYKNGCCE